MSHPPPENDTMKQHLIQRRRLINDMIERAEHYPQYYSMAALEKAKTHMQAADNALEQERFSRAVFEQTQAFRQFINATKGE